MGQLERYGLYVLCLVIFLILGVAIWGGDPAQAAPDEKSTLSQVAAAPLGDVTDDFFDRVPVQTAPITDVHLGLETVADVTPPAAQPVKSPVVAPVKEQSASGYREYKIKRGDVLGTIAQRELGSTDHVPAIRALNPSLQGDKIQVGHVLRLPTAGSAGKAAAKPTSAEASGKTYKVLDGENPWTISQKVFKTNKYTDEIMALNGIRDPKKLKVGSILKLPAHQ